MIKVFDTIILLATLQGFILSGLLFFTRKNRPASRLLAWLILLMTLASLNLVLAGSSLVHVSGIIATLHVLVPLLLVMPMGPLIYFYIRSSTDPTFRVTRQLKKHYLPVIIDLVPSITGILFFCGASLGWIYPDARPWGIFLDDYNVYADIPRWVSVTIYLCLSARYLSRLRRQPASRSLSLIPWLWLFVRLFFVFQVIWLLYLVPYVIPSYTNKMLDVFYWYPIYLPMAILIYGLGIKGYLVAQQQPAKLPASTMHSFAPAQLEHIVVQIRQAVERDRLYLNPRLTLADLSQHTGLAPKMISAVLNQHLQTSFNEFVNGYRIALFKEKIGQETFNHLTIAGIAQECGFNSAATFQRSFKAYTGISPTEYRQTLLKDTE